jgi:PST family polysaccharide transporter
MMFEKILGMAVVLLVGIWVARYLGPERFGSYSFVLAIIALATPLSELGLNATLTRELVRNPQFASVTLGSAFGLRVFGAFLSGILSLLAIRLLRPGEEDVFLYLAMLAFGNLFSAFAVVNFWFEAAVLSKHMAIARSIVLLTMAVAKIALIIAQASLSAFILVSAIELAFSSLAMAIAYMSYRQSPKNWSFQFSRATVLLSESWPLILSGFAATIYLKIDQIMLAQMVSDQAVGIYAVASRISEVWYIVPTVLVSSLFPKIIELRDGDLDKFKRYMQKGYDSLFILSLAIAIPVSIFAEPIVLTLFGKSYQDSAPILAIHVWAGLFIFMRALLSKWLVIEHLLMFSLVTHGLGALINVILNIILIPLYGALGAAIATVVSYSASSYLTLFISKKTREAAWMMTIAFVSPVRLLLALRR